MNFEERRKGLLRLVAEYREQECRRILAAARQEAAELTKKSFRRERAQLHDQVVSERSRARVRIQAARAEHATRARRTSERASVALLNVAWPLLRERLLARWSVPEERRHWTEGFLYQALDLLPRGSWMVRHAPEWQEADRLEIVQTLTDRLGETPVFRSEDGIEAGLIVECTGAVLDASLNGLLRDRAQLESRLLALVDEAHRA
jgi:hypothetical protein